MSLLQSKPFTVTLAIGGSAPVPDTDVTVTVEDVTDDSRCPTGVTCIWEGDAVVHVRVTEPKAQPATYLLHTSGRFTRTATHGKLKLQLVEVKPYPAADTRIRREAYRVTLSVERE